MWRKIWNFIKSFFVTQPDVWDAPPLERDEGPKYGFVMTEGQLPETLEKEKLYILTEDGVSWEAAMICPCGCGTRLEMNLLPDERPRWRYSVRKGLPSLHPSVNRKIGCRSHFILRQGRIIWATDYD